MTSTPHTTYPTSSTSTAWETIRTHAPRRRSSGQWLGGVCTGLADRAGVSTRLIRIIFAVLTVLGGFGIAIYLAAWLLMPDQSGAILAETMLNGDRSAKIGLVVLSLIVLGGLGVHFENPLVVLLVVGGLVYWVRHRRQHHRHAQGTVSTPGAVGTDS